MYDEFSLENWLDLSDANIAKNLLQSAQRLCIPKDHLLVETGETQLQLPILLHGVVRGFLLDADGRDITDCFAHRAGSVLTGSNSLNMPSSICMETMTPCEVVTIPIAVLLPLLSSSIELMQIYNSILLDALQRHWEEKLMMHRCTAMERYQWFLSNYPGLIDLVSHKHIASFLGMTPVTLSRLRLQLREMEKQTERQEES